MNPSEPGFRLWYQHLDRSSVSRMFCLSLVSALGAISQPAATKIVLLTLAHKIVSPIRCSRLVGWMSDEPKSVTKRYFYGNGCNAKAAYRAYIEDNHLDDELPTDLEGPPPLQQPPPAHQPVSSQEECISEGEKRKRSAEASPVQNPQPVAATLSQSEGKASSDRSTERRNTTAQNARSVEKQTRRTAAVATRSTAHGTALHARRTSTVDTTRRGDKPPPNSF